MNEQAQRGLEQALARVHSATADSGLEHLIIVDRSTGELGPMIQGDDETVKLPAGVMVENKIVVHSHPVELPISFPDMMSGLSQEMPVYAITPNKWVSWTTGVRGEKAEKAGPQVIELLAELGFRAYGRKLAAAGLPVGDDTLEAMRIWTPLHWAVKGLQALYLGITMDKLKFVEYRFSAPPATIELLDSYTKKVFGDEWALESWANHPSFRAKPLTE
jgi:hypothetical protein